MPNFQKIELINKKEFVVVAQDENTQIFLVHIAALSFPVIQVYPICQTRVGLLLTNKTLIKVLSKYLNYANNFLFDFVIELLENISINKILSSW